MIVEFIAKSGDYWMLIKRFSSGHRAAYVGVPKGHRLYGREEDWPEVRAFTTLFGKVNYADHRVGGWEGHPREEDIWWFGVDNMYKDEPTDSLIVTYVVAQQLVDQVNNGVLAPRPVVDRGRLKNAPLRRYRKGAIRRKRVG